METGPLIYIVAGEASGDLLGARLMAALKKQTQGKVSFAGVGGAEMQAKGLTSLFPMQELSLIGIVEVLPHIPRLLRRWRETMEDIASQQPAILITIDVPGFAQKLVKMVRRRMERSMPIIHYVAPTVWAYRPKRAAHLAKNYDALLVLLPFEPPYFEKEGLPTYFIGHPVVEANDKAGNAQAFRIKHAVPPEENLLAMLPGSRKGELKRHMPLFREVSALLKQEKNLSIIMPVALHLMPQAHALSKNWPLPLYLVDSEERNDAFAACRVALAKSGTVTLELAMAGVAMVTIYKVNAVSAWLLERMLLIRRFNLINILLNQEIIPELMQKDATPEKISAALQQLLHHPDARIAQISSAHMALKMLGLGNPKPPSEQAAMIVLNLIAGKPAQPDAM